MYNKKDNQRDCQTSLKNKVSQQIIYKQRQLKGRINEKLKISENIFLRLESFFQKKLIYGSFHLIMHYASIKKNKQLIYAAVNRKIPSKISAYIYNKVQTFKSSKREKKLQIIQKQKIQTFDNHIQEEFIINDNMSSIVMNNSLNQSFGKDSHIDLFQLLQINKSIKKDRHQKQNRIIFLNGFSEIKINKTFQNSYEACSPYFKDQNLTDKRQKSMKGQDQTYLNKDRQLTINKIKSKQSILVIRQNCKSQIQLQKRSKSLKIRYIKIPVQSHNISFVQLKNQKKRPSSVQSSHKDSKQHNHCSNTCDQNSLDIQCNYCSMIKKSTHLLMNLQKNYI